MSAKQNEAKDVVEEISRKMQIYLVGKNFIIHFLRHKGHLFTFTYKY